MYHDKIFQANRLIDGVVHSVGGGSLRLEVGLKVGLTWPGLAQVLSFVWSLTANLF